MPKKVVKLGRPPRSPGKEAPKKPGKRPLRVISDKHNRNRDERGFFAPSSEDEKRANLKAKVERHIMAQRAIGLGARDIATIDFSKINWERRKACERNLRLYCETYMKPVFRLGWADDHLKCIHKLEAVYLDGGKFALAMPRGQGKTSLCQASILWGTGYAHRRFPYFIGSTDEKAQQTLTSIKTYWFGSPFLYQDFPEIAHPVRKTENRFHLVKGQVYRGYPTHLDWGADSIKYPICIFSKEDSKGYLRNCPEFLIGLDEELNACEIETKQWTYSITKSSGINILTAGIGGSIRGDAIIHPVTLRQDRPDLVLLDDIQKDQKADSPNAIKKTIELIDGAVTGLSGPGEPISAIMPCTVIKELDVSDTYLTPELKHDWNPERCALVIKWPEGLTDTEISLDSPAGRAWSEYDEERKKSYRLHGDFRLATEYYAAHRDIMDNGFVCSWEERYDKKKELSPQQHAMNLRFSIPTTFISEYQNRGRNDRGISHLITARQLMEKTIAIPEFHVAGDTRNITAFIDVQDELLYYGVFACAPDFTGAFTHYGSWPQLNSSFFLKYQAQGWGSLSREFFARYPEQRNEAWQNAAGKMRAPFEAKLYYALGRAVAHLLSMTFTKDDGFQTQMSIQKIGIDAHWGQANDVIKRFCRECGRPEVVPYIGVGISPTNKQYEEYTRTKGWLFEDQVNPQVKEVKWVYKPDESGQYMMHCDVNRMKTFLASRLSSPFGTPGCISMYDAPPEVHEMWARHVCDSEYPEPVTARGITKEMWLQRESNPDNEYLDIAVGCLCLASYLGAYLKTDSPPGQIRPRRRLSAMYAHKRQAG
jgi:hypothetical protein